MRASTAIGAVLAQAIAASAIAGQQRQDTPESLLPPGFGDQPTPAPAPREAAPRDPDAASSDSVAAPATAPMPLPSPSPSPSASPTPIDPALLARYEMPAFARRSLTRVGVVDTGAGGLPANAFGDADGPYLETLMRRLSAPLPSRWLSIALRRTLLSQIDTPRGVNGADFAGERAWLLLRMGESVAARSITQGVDTDKITPKLRQIAMQTTLATGDPGGLCPLAASAPASEPGWILARMMCAGLSGTPRAAAPLLAAARRKRVATGIDLLLAQKVMGAGADGRQAVTIEWDSVTQLTTWRFGLAIATGVTIPDPLYDSVGPQVAGWRALSPAIPMADRTGPAARAAAMGVLSNAALVDLYAALDASDDTPGPIAAVATDLRTAYVAADRADRLAALQQLWAGSDDPADRYARLILTARAAAQLPVADGEAEADRIVAAMLAAGLDRTAQRWRGRVPDTGDAWAMLSLADPDFAGRIGYGALAGYSGSGNAAAKQRVLFAGLAGLGRLAPDDIERGAAALDVPIGVENGWTRALDRAARAGQSGTVVLLAATGMQTGDWRGVPPAALYRIILALRTVGLGGEARMIAAEAIART